MLPGFIFLNRKMLFLSYFLESYYQLLNFEEIDLEKLYKEFIHFKTIQLANNEFLTRL